jgi:hypothetical protein
MHGNAPGRSQPRHSCIWEAAYKPPRSEFNPISRSAFERPPCPAGHYSGQGHWGKHWNLLVASRFPLTESGRRRRYSRCNHGGESINSSPKKNPERGTVSLSKPVKKHAASATPLHSLAKARFPRFELRRSQEDEDRAWWDRYIEPRGWNRPRAGAGCSADRHAFVAHLAPLRKIEWVVYAKRPFAGPQAVLAYLSRYTPTASPSPTAG